MRPINIYLAGKVSKNGWREAITRHSGIDGQYFDADERWVTKPSALDGGHNLTGPFFVSCDHGCAHGRDSHGVFNERGCIDYGENHDGSGERHVREYIARECLAAIRRADIVFALLDNQDAFGTLVELGYARAFDKYIAVNVPHADATPDLWFAKQLADVVIVAPDVVDAFEQAVALFQAKGDVF